ncbi:ABC transporter ATP-binding protein, putative [Hondaea fermentalgiana]|uniref:ABC transporter ATP-binding protein, putative n=1 Tax=Hondaea fermentalgiana TaxID=2315210 RepID=A0A2R5G8H4_9STRA|nr:ABC transporter ATP-binding protein, putative [Hondaea fermentalgiana]|eukprot:GBG26845.1 ABC transporter ATP-binding protein, putative [Hondaea fermentalgiana]
MMEAESLASASSTQRILSQRLKIKGARLAQAYAALTPSERALGLVRVALAQEMCSLKVKFDTLDTCEDGMLSLDELSCLLGSLVPEIDAADVSTLFSDLDVDGSCALSYFELERAVREISPQICQMLREHAAWQIRVRRSTQAAYYRNFCAKLPRRVYARLQQPDVFRSFRTWKMALHDGLQPHAIKGLVDHLLAVKLGMEKLYEVMQKDKKRFIHIFTEIDASGDGTIDAAELQGILCSLGMTCVTLADALAIIRRIDLQGAQPGPEPMPVHYSKLKVVHLAWDDAKNIVYDGVDPPGSGTDSAPHGDAHNLGDQYKVADARAKPEAEARARSSSMVSTGSTGSKRRKYGDYVSVTTHPGVGVDPIPIHWGASDPMTRGPIVCTTRERKRRNSIGAHGGSYSIYRALSIASGALDKDYRPNYAGTEPAADIGPFPSWSDPKKIATIDPWGAVVTTAFKNYIEDDELDIRPTIAITRAHIDFPEIKESIREGRLKPDGEVLTETGQVKVTKAAIEPVWYLPVVAERFGVSESELRHLLFTESGGMYPELLTRTDLKTFLPPIGGVTAYIFGDPKLLGDKDTEIAVRVHDECNGSDVFGSDICTCRPYLAYAMEYCVRHAQKEEGKKPGLSFVLYYRKEGRALGETLKYLVYNSRKRQKGGDQASEYFNCTAAVAGVQDARFQSLMPDALHWLGITRIDKFISMSNMKYDAIVSTGIEIVTRVPIPKELVPQDAQVEITAKVAAGYDGGQVYKVSEDDLKNTKGRARDEAQICETADVEAVGLEAYTEAVCADGSPARYYVHGSNTDRFIIWLGDNEKLCKDPETCASYCSGEENTLCDEDDEDESGSENVTSINATNLDCYYDRLQCSSEQWDLVDVKFSSLLCDDTAQFGDATRVFVPSCTLDWHLGRGDAVNPANNYFKGAEVIDAVLDDLQLSRGLSATSEVIFGGTRGGGVGAAHHAARLTDNDPFVVGNFATTSYKDLNAAFEFDANLARDSARWIDNAPLSQECVDKFVGSPQKCLYASNLLPLTTFAIIPTLVLQSQFDLVNLFALGIADADASSSFLDDAAYSQAVLAYMRSHGINMRQEFELISNEVPEHRYWSPGCAQHGWIVPVTVLATNETRNAKIGDAGSVNYARTGEEWSQVLVDNMAADTMVANWIQEITVTSAIDRCVDFLCGETCPTRVEAFELVDESSTCQQTLVLGYAYFVIALAWVAFIAMRIRVAMFDRTCRKFNAKLKRERELAESFGNGGHNEGDNAERMILREAQRANKGRAVQLMVSNLSYWAPKKKRSAKPHQILDKVSVAFQPGLVHALMGPSGSGKSTLLDLVSYTRESGRVTGEHLINGVPSHLNRASFLREWLRNSTSYVRQTDVLFPLLTVRQHLRHAAWLQLPQFFGDEEKLRRVEQVITLLELQKCADTICGDGGVLVEGGISGGQRRRVSVATQLLSMPAGLLLDEPTSGLDSTNALVLVKSLHNLAHKAGVNIIMTIHQPRREIFQLLDDVTILVRGKIIFHGTPLDAADFFEVSIDEVNIGDEILDKLQGAPESRIKMYRHKYDTGSLGRGVRDAIDAERTEFSVAMAHSLRAVLVENALASGRWSWSAPISVITALWVLLSRTIKRGGFDVWRTALFALVAGVLVGIVFYGSDSYSSQVALSYLATSTLTFLASVFLGDRYNLEKGVWTYERANGNTVAFQAFLFSAFTRNIVAATIESLCYAVPLYYMSFLFNDSGTSLMNFLVLMMLTSIAVTAQNTMVEIFIIERGGESAPDTRKAALVNMSLLALAAVMNGFIINLKDIPPFLGWVTYLMVTFYSFGGTLINALGNRIIVEEGVSVLEQAQRAGSNIVRQFEFDDFDITTCIFALLCIVLAYHIISFFAFFFLYVFRTDRLKRGAADSADRPARARKGQTGAALQNIIDGGRNEGAPAGATGSRGMVISAILSRQAITSFLLIDFFLASTLCAFNDGDTAAAEGDSLTDSLKNGIDSVLGGGLETSGLNAGFAILTISLFLVYVVQFIMQILFLVPLSSSGRRRSLLWISFQDLIALGFLGLDAAMVLALLLNSNSDILKQLGFVVVSRLARTGFVMCYFSKVGLFHRSRARKLRAPDDDAQVAPTRDNSLAPPPGLSPTSRMSAKFSPFTPAPVPRPGRASASIDLGPMWRAYQAFVEDMTLELDDDVV